MSLALDIAVSAIRDQAQDLMGCFEALESTFEEERITDEAAQTRMAEALSAELSKLADWVAATVPNHDVV